jgi:hypothetical protein
MKYYLLIILLFIPQALTAEDDITAKTDLLRAAYLYKMGYFISTRPVDDIINIGVIGEDNITRLLLQLQGTEGFEHRYNLMEFISIDDYQPMHVVYFPGRFYDDESMAILLTHQSLIIGNEEFCWVRDYHVCLFQQGDLLQFKANITQMKKTGITVSSRFLRLAIETR